MQIRQSRWWPTVSDAVPGHRLEERVLLKLRPAQPWLAVTQKLCDQVSGLWRHAAVWRELQLALWTQAAKASINSEQNQHCGCQYTQHTIHSFHLQDTKRIIWSNTPFWSNTIQQHDLKHNKAQSTHAVFHELINSLLIKYITTA